MRDGSPDPMLDATILQLGQDIAAFKPLPADLREFKSAQCLQATKTFALDDVAESRAILSGLFEDVALDDQRRTSISIGSTPNSDGENRTGGFRNPSSTCDCVEVREPGSHSIWYVQVISFAFVSVGSLIEPKGTPNTGDVATAAKKTAALTPFPPPRPAIRVAAMST